MTAHAILQNNCPPCIITLFCRFVLTERIAYTVNKHLYCRGEDLVFFPDKIPGITYRGDDWSYT